MQTHIDSEVERVMGKVFYVEKWFEVFAVNNKKPAKREEGTRVNNNDDKELVSRNECLLHAIAFPFLNIIMFRSPLIIKTVPIEIEDRLCMLMLMKFELVSVHLHRQQRQSQKTRDKFGNIKTSGKSYPVV